MESEGKYYEIDKYALTELLKDREYLEEQF